MLVELVAREFDDERTPIKDGQEDHEESGRAERVHGQDGGHREGVARDANYCQDDKVILLEVAGHLDQVEVLFLLVTTEGGGSGECMTRGNKGRSLISLKLGAY